MTVTGWIVAAAAFAVAAVVFFLLGIRYRKRVAEKEISSAEEEATRIINEAIKSSESKKREALLEAKEEILKNRSEYEREVKERRAEQQKQERRLQQKEENLDHKTEMHRERKRRRWPRSTPPPTRSRKRSSSSSAARPRCWSASPASRRIRPRST